MLEFVKHRVCTQNSEKILFLTQAKFKPQELDAENLNVVVLESGNGSENQSTQFPWVPGRRIRPA